VPRLQQAHFGDRRLICRAVNAAEIAGTAAGLLRLFHGERPERSLARGEIDMSDTSQ
jgi:hypothetical protein